MNPPKRPPQKPPVKTVQPKKKKTNGEAPSPRKHPEAPRDFPAVDLEKLVHELGTHQIELELQNEELRRMQAELEASRNNYADLYDFAPIGYCTVDRSGLICEINLTAAKLLGMERSSLMHKPFSTYVEKESKAAYHLHRTAVFENRARQSIELRLKGTGSPGFYALLESVAVEDSSGKAVAVRTAVSDISVRKNSEETLRHANESLELNVAERTASLRENEERLRLALETQRESRKAALNLMEDAIESKKHAETANASLLQENAERRQAEQELRISEEKYRLLFENMAEGFALYELLYDEQGRPADWRVLEVNEAYRLHTGLSRDAIVGRRISELFPDAIPEYLPRFAEVVASQQSVEFETFSPLTRRHQHIVSFPAGPDRFANTITDITARKQAEAALREQELMASALINAASESIWLFGLEGQILAANAVAAQRLGMRIDEVIGKKWPDFMPTELGAARAKRVEEVVRTGGPVRFTDERTGTIYDHSAYPVRDDAGKISAVAFFSRDITESRRSEEERERLLLELQRRAAELDAIFNALPYLVSLHGSDGRYLRVNPTLVNLFGFDPTASPREETARRVNAHFPDGCPLTPKNMPSSRALKGETVTEVEYLITDGQGKEHLLQMNAVPLQIDGHVYGAVLAQIDITERKQAEEALRQSEMQFRTLADSIPNLAWQANGDGYITWYNRRWYEYTGTTPEQMEGWGWQSVHDPIVLPKVLEQWKGSIAQGLPFEMEFPLRGADGVFRSFLTRGLPVKGSDGRVLRWFGTNTDVSALKLAEEALQQTNAELAVINNELENFSYTVSHDLRTPLRAIEGFTTAIIDDYGASLNDAALGYLDRVVSASKRMSQLIDAMLNMARLTKGEMQERTVDLSRLAELAVYDLRKRYPGRTVDIVIEPGVKARCDSDMLTTVMENLLDNAWKFTSGHPAARIEFGMFDSNDQTVYFVRDDGAGFDMQFAEKLFLPFKRLHADAEFPGLGIGLATAHRIIMRHGGRMWTEAAVEKGATFYFTL